MDHYADTEEVIKNMARVKRVMNKHKGEIEDITQEELTRLLREEIKELEDAVAMIHVIEEAADAYNFLMAIVHKKVIAYRGRKDVADK